MHEVTIRRDDNGYYWHLSRPGRSGEESYRFETLREAIRDYFCCDFDRDADVVIRIPAGTAE